MYKLNKSMLFADDKKAMDQLVIVESINTGSTWRMGEPDLAQFFTGRTKLFYRVFNRAIDTIKPTTPEDALAFAIMELEETVCNHIGFGDEVDPEDIMKRIKVLKGVQDHASKR